MKLLDLGIPLGILASACATRAARPNAEVAPTPVVASAPSGSPPSHVEHSSSSFTRELSHLPPLSPVVGRGWQTKVPGSSAALEAGEVAGSENLSFSFEDSTPVACVVFPTTFEPASYVGQTVAELQKSVELVAIAPTRVLVVHEIPCYVASIFYRKQQPAGQLEGQFKIALGLHGSRPIACVHDSPGYSVTFERVVQSLLENYQVEGQVAPSAMTISVVRVGTLPVGLMQESTTLAGHGRTLYESSSAQIVPRSATELMVSDETESVLMDDSELVEGRYTQRDRRGQRMNLKLERTTATHGYRVSGTLDDKPIDWSFVPKQKLTSPDAISQRLKRELRSNRPFSFKQSDFHPGLDPTATTEVTYYRTKEDPKNVVHVRMGQLEMTTTLDEDGEQVSARLQAGSQTVTIERLYQRDDRKSSSRENRQGNK